MNQHTPLHERFRYTIDHATGCWVWDGATRNGYGTLNVCGRPHYSHRLSYLLHNGPLTDGALVCHHCDNPPCVNPDHIYAGDAMTNGRDCVDRGHHPAQRYPEEWKKSAARGGHAKARAALKEFDR